MDLQTITSLMLSSDYKERMKAEYYHLQNRKENLEAVVKLWDSGKLSFTPDARAKIEKIVLCPFCFSCSASSNSRADFG